VNAFRRRQAPEFWRVKEAAWLARPSRVEQPLRLRHDKRELADWFHELCREEGEPRLCAYCDGALTIASQETIDHFYPVHAASWLALSWDNLFPACNRCNSTNKGKRHSCWLLRPDLDSVEQLFDFELETGRLRAAPSATARDRVRVRITIHVLGLNDPDRCQARRRTVQNVKGAMKPPPDAAHLEELVNQCEYRFVARRVILALADLQP